MKAHLEAAPNSVDPLAVLEVALQARLLHVDHVINRCVLVNLSNLLATEMDAHLLDLNLAKGPDEHRFGARISCIAAPSLANPRGKLPRRRTLNEMRTPILSKTRFQMIV